MIGEIKDEVARKIIYDGLKKTSIDVLEVIRNGILKEAEYLTLSGSHLEDVPGMKRAADYIDYQIEALQEYDGGNKK